MGGKKKSSKVKPATATSVFSGVKNSNTNLPGFGVASSRIEGDAINNSFTPDAQISTILDSAKQGIQSNQGIFNLTPEQQFAQVDSNPYYQYAKGQNKLFLNEGQASARSAASRSGLENSTIAGAIEASLLENAALQDVQSRLGAIDYSRALAGENLGIHQGLLDQIYGYSVEPLDMTNDTLMNAGQNQDQVAMFNASQIQNARAMNAQLAQQARARRSALLGSLIGAGTSLLTAGGGSVFGSAVRGLGNFIRK